MSEQTEKTAGTSLTPIAEHTETAKALVGALKIISASSAVISCLPELPGYNGSILTIDDEETRRIERDLDEAHAVVADLIDTTKALTDSINALIGDGLIPSVALERVILQPAIAALAKAMGTQP